MVHIMFRKKEKKEKGTEIFDENINETKSID